MKKLTLLDLFCGAGGASVGYNRAGFDVTGVDIRPQPHYPFKFIKGDAVEFIREHGKEYDVIHASPPCQGYSKHTRPNSKYVHYSKGSDEPRLIDTIRQLIPKNTPYIIENVVGARKELIKPNMLCGTMFNLPIARHRLFETNFNFEPPAHPKCRGVAKKYSIDNNIDYRDMSVCGKSRRKGCIDTWKKLIGNHWMVCAHEVSESIPWTYTKSIGTALMTQITAHSEENNNLIISLEGHPNISDQKNEMINLLVHPEKESMQNPRVAGVYPSGTSLVLVLQNPEIEKKYPWRYYYQFIDPELAQPLYQEVNSLCVHRQGFSHGKAYTVGRKSCLFIDDMKPKSSSRGGYNRHKPHDFSQSPTLTKIRQQVEEWSKIKLPYALVHIYRTGKDVIPWHRDLEALDPDTSIFSISLGATRKFRFREIDKTSGWVAEYYLQSGDMIWMLPGCQSKVMHTVPVEKRVLDWRINITFRENIS